MSSVPVFGITVRDSRLRGNDGRERPGMTVEVMGRTVGAVVGGGNDGRDPIPLILNLLKDG